ncbi:hypothetical protein Csa_001697 [Cucumis sativus]|uniref:Uncharacterized protein n=1 Tax=Cucumis sativus TaxID=3659 RepID=A0A0A0LE60_CUCSA|nr:hypothetical protein Csa_001697 [Cucumis sativus]
MVGENQAITMEALFLEDDLKWRSTSTLDPALPYSKDAAKHQRSNWLLASFGFRMSIDSVQKKARIIQTPKSCSSVGCEPSITKPPPTRA